MSEETGTIVKRTNWIVRLFSNPWFGGVAAVCSIIAIPLSFYLAKEKRANLCYYVAPVRTSIVNSGQVSDLKVSMGNRQITNDLTSVIIAVWNSGRLPIRHDDILEPIVITSKTGVPIYKATLSVNRAHTEMIALPPTRNNVYTLDWRILEHNDGGLVQIIYGGGQNVDFTASGTIVGQGSITHITKPNKVFQATIANVFCFVMTAIAMITNTRATRSNKPVNKKVWWIILIFLLLALGCIIWVGISMVLTNTTHITPFGF